MGACWRATPPGTRPSPHAGWTTARRPDRYALPPNDYARMALGDFSAWVLDVLRSRGLKPRHPMGRAGG